jgi:hypothetical protein
VQGVEYIEPHESKQQSKGGETWFEVAACTECGHVYGVFPKVVLLPNQLI